MQDYEAGFGTPEPDTEPGMNLISVDFDLVMVNRTNERLYGKPMVALLGNKCYREFEKRTSPARTAQEGWPSRPEKRRRRRPPGSAMTVRVSPPASRRIRSSARTTAHRLHRDRRRHHRAETG